VGTLDTFSNTNYYGYVELFTDLGDRDGLGEDEVLNFADEAVGILTRRLRKSI
jgi:hypothetical protein